MDTKRNMNKLIKVIPANGWDCLEMGDSSGGQSKVAAFAVFQSEHGYFLEPLYSWPMWLKSAPTSASSLYSFEEIWGKDRNMGPLCHEFGGYVV